MSGESQYLEYIGVYNADASVWGEVSYWFGARLGIKHCSLCDVTHGLFRKRADWVQCADSLGVTFTTYHRDDAPHDVLTAANGNYPIVLGRTASSLEVVLNNPGSNSVFSHTITLRPTSTHERLEPNGFRPKYWCA